MKVAGVLFVMVASCVAQGAGPRLPLPYAPAPDDPYFPEQWHLEGLATDTTRYAIDINARSAWSFSRGEGVTIAIVDVGVDVTHPDLRNRANPTLHWNFDSDTPHGNPPSNNHMHGTPVAGLAVAEGNNGRGVTGVAPEAEFASWVIYRTNTAFVSSSQLAKMFEFKLDEVEVQNHSWVKPGTRLLPMSAEEDLAIEHAVKDGRRGRGVVMVRGAGNGRAQGRNVNDDAYTADPRAITVAAIRFDGVVASYSTPGASILIAAPGGEGTDSLMTTDLEGSGGYNAITFPSDPELDDYVFGSLGFTGTSAAAPLISGITALMLSENPELTVRDVQHILAQSGYQPDTADRGVQPNGAGFLVSDNTGFGTVNGGTALQLASRWTNVPPATNASMSVASTNAIPDGGRRLLITSSAPVPPELISIPTWPGNGPLADDGTSVVPLVHVGLALTPLTNDLTGKAALIQRGGTNFAAKIQHAADAGALFAIIYNNQGTNELMALGGSEFTSIPAVSISRRNGDALANLATNNAANAQLTLDKLSYEFAITNQMMLEHVLLHLDFFHEVRGDLRVTMVSPAGTRSILSKFGGDRFDFDGTWRYMSTHHFYESAVGTWRLEVSDESDGGVGLVRGATLEVRGIPIVDTDADGLDDTWEQQRIGDLASGPKDDPDLDGYSNAREQIQGLDPRTNDSVLAVDLSKWDENYVRLNWPARDGVTYEVLGASDLTGGFESLAFVTGGFPRVAWFGRVNEDFRFFTVREVAP